MLHDARAVANTLLAYGDREGIPISPLKVQKLIYFAEGHSWRTRQAGLVFNSFGAWDFGPVIKVVYDAFKDLGHRPINRRATWMNFAAGGSELAATRFSEEDVRCIEQAMSIYGPVDANILSRLSHARGGPWDIVRRDPARFPNNLIPRSLIAAYFTNESSESFRQ